MNLAHSNKFTTFIYPVKPDSRHMLVSITTLKHFQTLFPYQEAMCISLEDLSMII